MDGRTSSGSSPELQGRTSGLGAASFASAKRRLNGHWGRKKDDDLKRFYRRLADRRGRPKAKVAVARKLLVRSFIMLRDEIDYAEFQRRAVAARLARQSSRPSVPDRLIGQPASA